MQEPHQQALPVLVFGPITLAVAMGGVLRLGTEEVRIMEEVVGLVTQRQRGILLFTVAMAGQLAEPERPLGGVAVLAALGPEAK